MIKRVHTVVAVLPCLVLVLFAGQAQASNQPAAVTREFFRALDTRDWPGACELMLPQTRRHLAPHGRCARALQSTFRRTYQRFTTASFHWVSGRILALEPTVPAPFGAEVRFRLADRYVCRSLPQRRPCKRRSARYTREERLFLAADAQGRWRVAKTGAILRDMELPSPQYDETFLFPPTTPAGLGVAAQLPAPSFSCSGETLASVEAPSGYIVGPDYEHISGLPWLDADSLAIVRTGPGAICVSIGLLEPPHPDSEYFVFWHPPEHSPPRRWTKPNGQTIASQGSVAGWGEPDVEVGVDGNGVAHALINEVGALTQPSLAPYLPRFGFANGSLQIELTPRQGFTMNQRWALFAVLNAAPARLDPLAGDPLRGEDRVPGNECLLYPSGKPLDEFFCQGPSG